MRTGIALLAVLVTAIFAAAEEEDVRPASALVAEARARRERGELWEAEQLLRRAVEREPTAESLAELGTTGFMIAVRMVARGEGSAPGGGSSIRSILLDAARALNRSLELGESVRARVSLGLTKLHLGDARGCRLDLERAIAIAPQDPLAVGEAARDAYRRGDFQLAMNRFETLVRLRPDDAEARLWLGKSRYFGGRAAKAAAPLIEALRRDPDLLEGYAYLRGLLLNRGRHVEMERALLTVLEEHPDHVRALTNLGITRVEKGDAAGAEAIFLRLLPADPDEPADPDVRCWLGWLYAFKLDRLDDGLEQFRRVISVEPEHARARESMEYLMRRGIVEEDFAHALKVLDVWCAADPGYARAHAYRGLALRRLGRYAEAVKAYETAREADPMRAWIVSDLGLVHMACGRLDDAERTFRETLEIDFEFLDALENLGMLARMRGDPTAALTWFGKALEVARESRPDVVAKFRRYVDLVTWRNR